jgi:protocatechuate 3,4-dioxygenase beta subunit
MKFVLGDTQRSNVTEGQGGFPLYLDILLMNTKTCEPLVGAIIDIWHVCRLLHD